MIKKLLRSVREYKMASLLTPIFVTLEVIMEVLFHSLCPGLLTWDWSKTISPIPYALVLS